VYGFDVEDQLLKSPTSPDIMGLCRDGVWVSDYTYTGVMNFRGTGPGVASATAGARPSVLVWGRITRRGAVLEPALRVVAAPSLPSRPGSYSVEGITGDGGRAFRFSFDPVPVADGARGEGHFAFAVPLDERTGDRLESIRLAGPGTGIVALARRSATLRAPPVGREATLSAASRGATLRWDAAAYPVVMVRDAGSGQVLSFARGGQVLLPAEISEVELVLSDGVRSRHARVRR
jgi:hypothetical protein